MVKGLQLQMLSVKERSVDWGINVMLLFYCIEFKKKFILGNTPSCVLWVCVVPVFKRVSKAGEF